MGRQKTYQREQLLERAMLLFWEKGYTKTSMAELATATGVDKKCLFREFVNKEKFFEEVLELYCRWDFDYFETVFNCKPLGLSNIKKFLNGLNTDHGNRGCLLNKSIVQRNLITNKHFAIIQKTLHHLEALLLLNLQAASEHGELRHTSSPEALAKYLVYSTQGISTMSLFESNESTVEMVLNSIISAL